MIPQRYHDLRSNARIAIARMDRSPRSMPQPVPMMLQERGHITYTRYRYCRTGTCFRAMSNLQKTYPRSGVPPQIKALVKPLPGSGQALATPWPELGRPLARAWQGGNQVLAMALPGPHQSLAMDVKLCSKPARHILDKFSQVFSIAVQKHIPGLQ